MGTQRPRGEGPPRIVSLDVLRGLAILGVITVHTLGPVSAGLPPVARSLVANGARGVQLFLVVSALLAFASLDRNAGGRRATAAYYRRRYFRLAPVFYLALGLTLLQDAIVPRDWPPGSPAIDLPNVIAHLGFVNAFNPFWINSIMGIEWVLAVEAVFFAAAPLLFRWIRSGRVALAVLAVSAPAAVAGTAWLATIDPVSDPFVWNDYLGISPLAQAPVLAAGIVAYLLDREFADRGAAPRAWALAGGTAVAASMAAGLVRLPGTTSLVVFGVAFAAIVFGAMGLRAAGWVGRATAYLGRTSYGSYLFHLFVLDAVLFAALRLAGLRDGPALRAACLPLVVAGSALVAAVVGRWVERPAAALGERLSAR